MTEPSVWAPIADATEALAAEVLELRTTRRELGEALVRVTEERDVAQAAYDSLRAASIEHTERHRSIFDEHLRQVAQLTSERDEARDEVVRLSRNPESQTSAFREERETLNAELVRLRTIIVELGAGEAAEPQEEIEALRPEGEL